VIGWQNPTAFVALVALVGPAVIHLLQRRRARRVLFPTDRFIRASPTGAVRVRAPDDRLLLLLRLAIVALAVCAVGQPVVLTSARLRAWNSTVARAVLVDVSDSMTPLARDAATVAHDEMRSAATAVRIDSADLEDGVRRAAASLRHAPPARREVVVVSDFQRGALTAHALAPVDAGFGVRFVRVGTRVDRRTVDGEPLLGIDGMTRRPQVAVEEDRTSVAWQRIPSTSGGLTVGVATEMDRSRLLKAVAASGTPAPAPEQPVVLTFGGVHAGVEHQRLPRRWMLETVLRLRNDPELRLIDAAPAIRARWQADALVLDVQTASDTYLAAAALRGVLTARHAGVARTYAEYEVNTIDDMELAAWSRSAGDVQIAMWRHADRNDARWFWGLVLALLAVETVVRTRARS
jgi:hypothetical protein